MSPPSEEEARLRRLWEGHRRRPFPAASTDDPRFQEVALYESWLGGIVEAALAHGGRLSAAHATLLDFRRHEGNRALWAAAAELGEGARLYVAQLIGIEDALSTLPRD